MIDWLYQPALLLTLRGDSQGWEFPIRCPDGEICIGGHVMGAKVAITRMDHTGAELRAQSAKCADGAQVRRMLALALVLDGRSRSEAAVLNGMDRQTLRDWVHRYNGAGIEGLKSRKSPGREPYLTTQQMAERLKFAGITLFTLAEGEISELHIGLKGTMNALFLKDLAEKTRRGL